MALENRMKITKKLAKENNLLNFKNNYGCFHVNIKIHQ